ncbi:hypothetical protein CALCODRAFT_486717 [Calocera cornea HHB12733]|uniref:Uncharacterized protein n=1 Tax=Calocera cornea HHB12733 TaxID=1353952 RepID=A0A165CD25_9BASI|nr:hypothetical protein CALCODRAFT_488578 [Calocera cornea HHB12733]KZT53012.1 hypothetical protein CALCODRAFT_486717 [Calocera cornea HHB12733]
MEYDRVRRLFGVLDGRRLDEALSTYHDGEPQDIPLDLEGGMLVNVTLKVPWLVEALIELAPTGDDILFEFTPFLPPALPANATPVQINASRRRSFLRSRPTLLMEAGGFCVHTGISLPLDSEIFIETVIEQPVSFSYRFKHLMQVLPMLRISKRARLTVDHRGVMSIVCSTLYPRISTEGTGRVLLTDTPVAYTLCPLGFSRASQDGVPPVNQDHHAAT